jgi:DNA primase small subunit
VDKTEEFLKNQFAAYYRRSYESLTMPPDYEQREFAFFWFTRRGALRHTSFTKKEELTHFIANEGPAHIFYSAAKYGKPDAPQMPLKEWEGANLIFDIDADHLILPCQKLHDRWLCTECDARGKGRKPEACPGCAGHGLQELKWMCKECLGAAKSEAIKIVEEFLLPDFGIVHEDIMIVFSGHRGYHIHCFTEEVQPLGSAERREIVDYVSGTGLDFLHHGLVDQSYGIPKGPDIRTPGWEQKLARGIKAIFKSPSKISEIPQLKVSQKEALTRRAASILRQLEESPPRYVMPKGIGKVAWRAIAQFAVEQMSAEVDEPVTTDIHRLIRLPGSLHGKTGFLVKQLDMKSLERFDPFSDAQVFEGSMEIFVKESPRFRLGNTEYPAMRECQCELPLSVAILLLGKGVATINE